MKALACTVTAAAAAATAAAAADLRASPIMRASFVVEICGVGAIATADQLVPVVAAPIWSDPALRVWGVATYKVEYICSPKGAEAAGANG